MHRLFNDFANRYDLHTPPEHYRHDHAFILEQATMLRNPCRMLDVGCGTGVLLEKAIKKGILATGLDASEAMVRIANQRLGHGIAIRCRMQDITVEGEYDLIVALSWTINYCENRSELCDVLTRMHRALRPGGRILLQAAHSAHVCGKLFEDRECGPGGAGDVAFRYRFSRIEGVDWPMKVDYEYECKSHNENFAEPHILHMADAFEVVRCAHECEFINVDVYDSWRCNKFQSSASPFVIGNKRTQ